MGGNNHDKAEVIQSMMFVSSISTLLQTLVGTRLPVGASHTFVIPMKTIVLSMSLLCIDQPQPPEKTFANTMARMQGALLVASVIQIILGFSGLWRLFVRSLSPLSMVPLITFTGLGLFSFGFPRSTGTFIAAARYASATPVPPSVISRGTFWLGIGTLLNGVCGAVTGPTASVESAGLLGLTRVGSRRVIQISTGFMLIFSIFGKLAAFFASVPYPIMAATYCILYAYV
uniref:Uncharacterized protein n=1 Tax=Chenopodium quinoa TaxID=63459 RepID=A0A803M2M0_CHEQI